MLMIALIGFIVGAAVVALIAKLRSNLKLTWYEWLIGVIGALLLVFSVLLIESALGKPGEPTNVVWWFLLGVSLPGIILLIIAWRLVSRHREPAS
ncbi:reductive dehalogenase membrane anchor [Dehalogenimonas formicexedens]|uniref:Reductive dehalogenase membrane anchor n=1 Tax=Dehalogenimonas formicexedens TaxID=1839801 RepID=A0A1P8F860_9CHLR|nr:hypothetical protein [Dehalogenimonas formicexedens]APV44661.1 reductive dehalogenase membrane anchor [Dehalogenimonas formicexedens]